jgi:rubrerythrin
MSTKKGSNKGAKQGAKPRAKSDAKPSVKSSTKPNAKPRTKKTAAAAKPKRARVPKRASASAAGKSLVPSASEFMAYAYAMEAEAAERYAEFADSMEVHNNREVAELFRKLSRIEQIHADQILEQMGWKQAPATAADVRWEGAEGPETADPTELHYLMQPYHALQIALHNEKRARDFFAHLAKATKDAGVRAGALEMKKEEAEHVRLIEAWIKRTPVPKAGWEADLDPPVLSD